MAKQKVAKQKAAPLPQADAGAAPRKNPIPFAITNPADGDTINGTEFSAVGTAPASVAKVTGNLARADYPTTNVDGTPKAPPSPWSIFFNSAAVLSLFHNGETKLQVVLTVRDADGVQQPQVVTFTIDKGNVLLARNQRRIGAKPKGPPNGITPNPVLAGRILSCPFDSTGTAPAGPIYAFVAGSGVPSIMGQPIQMPQDHDYGFDFMWLNLPAGTGYTIYYQTGGSNPVYAQDGPFTVQ
jgi:hypothetical protein